MILKHAMSYAIAIAFQNQYNQEITEHCYRHLLSKRTLTFVLPFNLKQLQL